MGGDWSIQRRRRVGEVEVESDISHSGNVREMEVGVWVREKLTLTFLCRYRCDVQ